MVVLPNCCNYSKNPALLVHVLEVTLRLKPTFCVALVQFPQRCYFPGRCSQNLHCHPLLAHSVAAPLPSLSPWHPNTDKKLRDVTAALWELGQRFAQEGICTTAHEGFPLKVALVRGNIIKHEHRQ